MATSSTAPASPLSPPAPPRPIAEDAALEKLDAALVRSVDLHQRSDVPYGMFLSGGIDSAAILAAMARLNNERVLAFTAGFASPRAADERAEGRDRRQIRQRPPRKH